MAGYALAALLVFGTSGICSAARSQREPLPSATDSVSPHVRAILALIESQNRLNDTARELLLAALQAERENQPDVTAGVNADAAVNAAGGTGSASSAAVAPSRAGTETYGPAETGTATAPNGVFLGEGLSSMDVPAADMPEVRYPAAGPVAEVPGMPVPSIEGEGGTWLLVPDSLVGRVSGFLLNPDYRLPTDTSALEAIVAGTIGRGEDDGASRMEPYDPANDPEILRDRNIGRFHRGLFNYRFIPKGEWAFGLTASYGEFNSDDVELFDVITGIDFGGYMFSIKPQVQYFIRDNMAIGLRLNYTRTRGSLDHFGVEIDEDMSFNLHDILYTRESYAASMTYTQYLGLSRRGRFSVFNEVELTFSSGSGDFTRPYDSKLKTTHTTTTGVGLNFSPGLSVFMMKNASFNISFGVFGFYLENEKQWVDGEPMGNRLTSGANFRFNIFNINFGLAIHI